MYTIRKKFKVEYAHVLDSAYSKACSDTIHGHSGVIEVFFQSKNLNDDGMVIDFGLIKEKIGNYISSFDHSLIISKKMNENLFTNKLIKLIHFNKNLKIVDYNPTAENMAKDIFQTIKKILKPESEIKESKSDIVKMYTCLSKVRFHETDTGYAEYSDDYKFFQP